MKFRHRNYYWSVDYWADEGLFEFSSRTAIGPVRLFFTRRTLSLALARKLDGFLFTAATAIRFSKFRKYLLTTVPTSDKMRERKIEESGSCRGGPCE